MTLPVVMAQSKIELGNSHRWFLATQKIDTVVRENLSINFGSDISVALASQRKDPATRGNERAQGYTHLTSYPRNEASTYGYGVPAATTSDIL